MIVLRPFAMICFVLLTTFAWGHGDAAHVMGTVTDLGDNHIVVKTQKGTTVSLAFRSNTTFKKNGIHSNEARPQIGDRLVAEVTKKGLPKNHDWVATEVTFATPKKN